MKIQRHQWVGLLAGVPLFSGSWLTAHFNNPWFGVLGLFLTIAGFYIANRVERKTSLKVHLVRGFVAGILAGLVARLLGYGLSFALGVTTTVEFHGIGDLFRAVLAGSWLASALLIVVCGLLGLAIVSLEPEAKSAKGARK